MPNWCSNTATFTHADPSEIKKLVEAFNEGRLMQTFRPCPEELRDPRSSSYGGPDGPANDALRARLEKKYGYGNWYDWSVANWGTKWDFSGEDNPAELEDGSTSVTISFDSAWGPPIAFYEYMLGLDFTVDAYYYEGGMAFCGHFHDGVDNSYEIRGNSDWVDENIPEDINEMFNIAGSMSDWESEQENEEAE